MDLRRLEDWIEYCEEADGVQASGAVDGSGWLVSASTPPPVLGDPIARIPLERAQALRARLELETDPAVAVSLRREALAWLDHPHPGTTPVLTGLLTSERLALESLAVP